MNIVRGKLEYLEKYVIFIDILGWSALVAKTQSRAGFLARADAVIRRFALAYEKSRRHVNESGNHPTSPIWELFSDSLIITIPYLKNIYWPEEVVFETCREISRITLESGLLVRGGITRGPIVHESESRICFGPALLQAYYLESQIAIYPRIVIDPSIVEYLNAHNTILKVEHDKHQTNETLANPIRIMSDGVHFIDYLVPRTVSRDKKKVLHSEQEEFESRMRKAISIGKDGVSEFGKSLKVRQKYDWYLKYVSEVMLEYSLKKIT